METTTFCIIAIFVVLGSCEARDLGVGERVSTWVRELPFGVGPAVDRTAVRPVRRIVDTVRDRIQRESPNEHVSYFVKRMEAFLSRLVPNQNMVQDLMGMPEPDSSLSNDVSQEISTILRSQEKYRPQPEPFRRLPQPDLSKRAPLQPSPLRGSPQRNPLQQTPVRNPLKPTQHRIFPPRVPPPPSLRFLPLKQDKVNPLSSKRPPALYSPPLRKPKHTTSSVEASSSVFSKLPVMLHRFAEDWFRRNE